MKSRKSWRSKMENPNLPKIVEIPPRMHKKWGTGRMVLPHPREVEAYICAVPKGSVVTISQIRRALAEEHNADITCPLLTGIFVRITAEAAEEDAAAGKTSIAPYWRVVKDDGALNPKFPGGVERQGKRLRSEGHRVAKQSGRKTPRISLAATSR
jgi:hypothetical protein